MNESKSNYQHEIDQFNNAFSVFQDKRIILYGIGRYTATILSELGDKYNIAGLMDKDPESIGKTIKGVQIISLKDAEKLGDIIIINTQEMYWQTIYRRIKESKIPVYYKNGQRATDNEVYFLSDDPYWNVNAEYIYKKAQDYDVISFDIFDTLITRKVLVPKDIFMILEKRAKEHGINTSIVELRTEINADVIRNLYSYDDIYKIIQERLSLSDSEVEWLKNEEMNLERELSSPRGTVVELYNKLAEEKQCFLVSDMYYSADFIYSMLDGAGIKKHVPLWISCEKGATKKEGDLWKKYREFIGNKRALHIGDNQKSDVDNSKEYGIDSIRVLSPFSLWEKSSLSGLLPRVTVDEEIWAGLIAERLFSDPFVLSKSKGKVVVSNTKNLGYVYFGSLIHTFLSWIISKTQNKTGRVIFFSRDGYWLVKDYNYLKELYKKNKKKEKISKTEYLAISRKLVLVSSIDESGGWEKLISFPYAGTYKYFMKTRLDTAIPEDDINANEQIAMPADYNKVNEWIMPYKKEILKTLKKEKENYLDYLTTKHITEKDFVVDLWFNGNNQYYLSKAIHKNLTGFYIVANLLHDNKCAENNTLMACFQDEEDKLADDNYIYKQAAFVEAFLTAPYGMISYIDDSGELVCSPKKENQKRWNTRCEINEGVKEYMKEIEGMKGMPLGTRFINKIWQEIFNGKICIEKSICGEFFSDNALIKEQEEQVFN